MRQLLATYLILTAALITSNQYPLHAGDADKKESTEEKKKEEKKAVEEKKETKAEEKKDKKEAKDVGPISHDVFFTLNDNSPEKRDEFVQKCRKYLQNHPGELHFAVGARAESLKREVNDLDFDVALHIVFRDMESQNLYQSAPRHEQFRQEGKALVKKVRVFDSTVQR